MEILEGSGSTTVAQLVANSTNPVAYVDAATMMRGVGAGMPIKAVGVTLQQSPMAFIYRADAARPTKISEIKGSRIAITAGDASLAIFTAFMGKLGMKVEDVQMITVANPAVEGAGGPQQAGRRAARLLHGPGPAHAAADRREDGLDAALRHGRRDDAEQRRSSSTTTGSRTPKNQDQLRRFLRASQRGWEYTDKHRDEAADDLHQARAGLQQEIALLEINGTMTIIHTKHTEGKPIVWSAEEDWKESQDLLEKFAKLKPRSPT